ncbi:MAG: ABC transporter ATP-binding protein [Crenarchaeota archaeon]|nr:ABC transporter ATP-binding protein [Thermoproteota archaeon]
MAAIKTIDLTRVFKREKSELITALDKINIEVEEGEIFGLLGPNGAGKTTLIKILCTLLSPTRGKAYVHGYDVEKEHSKIREIINVVSGGESSGYGMLTVRENLWFFSQLYGFDGREAKRRIDMLIESLSIGDFADVRLNKLSTGMFQKFHLARGLINNPKVLFLDEPTLGLDVAAAREIRKFVRRWIEEDPHRSILLTTHYMAEAEELCDRIAIIHKGRIIALGSPRELVERANPERVFEIECKYEGNLESVLKDIAGIKASLRHDPETGFSKMRLVLVDADIDEVVKEFVSKGVSVLSLKRAVPTLEDVFLTTVGVGLVE